MRGYVWRKWLIRLAVEWAFSLPCRYSYRHSSKFQSGRDVFDGLPVNVFLSTTARSSPFASRT